MRTKVTVTSKDGKSVVNISENNQDFGYIRVEQRRTKVVNGFIKSRVLSALIHGRVEELRSLNLKPGDTLPGTIIVKESLTPFNKTNPEADYKYAGETGIVCCLDGQPIYRKNFYVEDENASDELIIHNNTEEIKAAYAAMSEKSFDIDQQ